MVLRFMEKMVGRPQGAGELRAKTWRREGVGHVRTRGKMLQGGEAKSTKPRRTARSLPWLSWGKQRAPCGEARSQGLAGCCKESAFTVTETGTPWRV